MITFSAQETSFIFNRKEWGVSGIDGEREREGERCSALVKKGHGVGHKLDRWSSIYEDLEMDFIKMIIIARRNDESRSGF